MSPVGRPPPCRVRGSAGRVVALALAGVLTLAGCSSEQAAPSHRTEPRSSSEPSATVAADEVTGIKRLLEERQSAVRLGSRSEFLAGVADEAQEAEATYFDNVVQLPLATYRLDLDRATVTAEEDGFTAVVNVAMQLRGFDSDPVRQPERFRFSGSGEELRVLSSRDAEWSAEAGALVQPWDTGSIQVRADGMVLGIFDDRSVGEADALMDGVQRSIDEVKQRVASDWEGSVVVYALSEDTFLRSLNLPGDADRLNAVSFAVHTAPHEDLRASTRIALNPAALTLTGAERDRLLRHELVHVSIGSRADLAPVWLSEGIAEYVAAEPMAPGKRSISRGALRAARSGLTGLPPDEDFTGPDAGTAYGIGWYAVTYLATNYGPYLPYDLLTAMHLRRDDQAPGDVLRDYTGMTEAELAEEAGRLIRKTYG